ncbi:MAG: phosphate ABC transporter permease subunit PstC, partial [Cyanobium sp.]
MALAPPPDPFALRRRPLRERLVDQGFRQLTVLVASVVGVVLLGILLTVRSGSGQAIRAYGLGFLTTSDWDPVTDSYGAFTAIYGTIVT